MWAIAAAVLLTLASGTLASEQLDCQSLGFTGLSLCSDCHELASFVKDEGAVVLLCA